MMGAGRSGGEARRGGKGQEGRRGMRREERGEEGRKRVKVNGMGGRDKNSSGDEIVNVNLFMMTSYMHKPAPTPTEPTS